jgi:hypothetical protein
MLANSLGALARNLSVSSKSESKVSPQYIKSSKEDILEETALKKMDYILKN